MRVSVLIEVSNHVFLYHSLCTDVPPPPQKKIADRDYF